MKRTKIAHDADNRMLGVRFGLHEGRCYLRFDLWWVSYRFTRKP